MKKHTGIVFKWMTVDEFNEVKPPNQINPNEGVFCSFEFMVKVIESFSVSKSGERPKRQVMILPCKLENEKIKQPFMSLNMGVVGRVVESSFEWQQLDLSSWTIEGDMLIFGQIGIPLLDVPLFITEKLGQDFRKPHAEFLMNHYQIQAKELLLNGWAEVRKGVWQYEPENTREWNATSRRLFTLKGAIEFYLKVGRDRNTMKALQGNEWVNNMS